MGSYSVKWYNENKTEEKEDFMKITEGYMPFLEYRTYYRVVGDIQGGKPPLVLLHGGPGSTHNYFELLDELAEDGRAIIMYDQLGCGLSMVDNHPELWQGQTWVDELIALREHLQIREMHLLGQSWGGMLAIQYLCDYEPEGIKSLILSSTLPSSQLWGQEQHRMIQYLPPHMQEAIRLAEETGNYTGEAYEAANEEFMFRHCGSMPTETDPECMTRPKIRGTEAYMTAWGPNEFTPLGNLKEWNYIDKLCKIVAPTLVISGVSDLCTPLIAKTMYDAIENSRWELFAHSRHMPFVDENNRYKQILREWLISND